MFKTLRLYRITPDWNPDLIAAQAQLERMPFTECGASQPESLGWVAPRGKAHAALVESIGGHWLLRLMTEQKIVPGSVINRRVEALAAQIEQQTGRKPGRKESKELKDQALLELLPMAFTKQAAIGVWIDPEARLLVLDTASASRADTLVSLLVEALPGFSVLPLHTAESPAAVMSAWLLDGEPPAVFSVDRDCELKTPDEMKSVVRYARHALDTDEVRAHIQAGKRPTQLALTWSGRVSFVLTDLGLIKKIAFLDGVFEDKPNARDADEGFDADAAIATGELSRLIPDLIDALGGEQAPGSVTALAPPGAATAPSVPVSPSTPAAPKAPPTSPASDDDGPPW
jgi:recombination associated protein RdgC